MLEFKIILEKLIDKHNLTAEETQWIMRKLLVGALNDIEMAGFLVALRSKGETVVELTTAVKVLRSLAKNININQLNLVDIVGTGGDGFQTFNISTTCCFIVAAAGGVVAKHGNRSISSKCRAADVLEKAGVNLDRSPEQVMQVIDELGIGFMFAPKHHTAMAHVAQVRKKLGIRTIFNLLGPLTNPANAKHHLIGVYDKKWLVPFAEVLRTLGSKKALIVHGDDGLDEISLTSKTQVAELFNHQIITYEIFPENFGIPAQSLQTLRVKNAEESLAMMMQVFNNEPGPARDIILLNAGAALYAADLIDSIAAGIEKVRELLDSGRVKELFMQFVKKTS